MRRGPALIVVGVVLVISILGFLLAALGSGPSHSNAPSGGVVRGTGLSPSPAASFFSVVRSGGDPPSDVLGALVVPAGSTATSHEISDAGVGLYDATVTLGVAAARSDIVSFYKSELKVEGWQISGPDATADGKGTELFGTHPSGDGYYWEVGVKVEGSNPSITPALNGDTPAGSSSLSLRLFEVDDAD